MNKHINASARRTCMSVVLFYTLFNFISSSLAETPSPTSNPEMQIREVFAGKNIEIKDYDSQLKQVIVDEDLLFASQDGRYIFAGPIYDTHQKIDIVAEGEAVQRAALINAQNPELFVSYPSALEQKHKITVVTDIDCPYCRKFHNTIGELNKLGVSVDYVMLPRAGINSASYARTLNALCRDDAPSNVTRAMANQPSPKAPESCDSSQLLQQMQLAQKMKIRSTPTFVLPNGKLRVGLLSTSELMGLLESTITEGS